MATKAEVKQRILKNVARTLELKSKDQLDPFSSMFIDAFAEMCWEARNDIELIKEEVLQLVAGALTPDSSVTASPAHTIIKTSPLEPVLEIGRHTSFYSDQLPDSLIKQGIKTVNFAPVIDSVRLVQGEITGLVCENNFYLVGHDGEKDLFAKSSAFTPATNRCVWIGLNLNSAVENLKDIHFYIEFPNTVYSGELYELLGYTRWSVNGKQLEMLPGINREREPTAMSEEDLFSRYNTLNISDRDIMDLYRKQFLHINNNIRILSLEKQAFPEELIPFFPERVRESEPQYWIKTEFPTFFKSADLNDLVVHLNVFPVSNKNFNTKISDRNKSLTGIVALTLPEGEHFFGIDTVTDSKGREYRHLPYASPGKEQGGTYTLKHGNLEKVSRKNITETMEYLIGLFRSEAATMAAMKIDNIRNVLTDIEQEILSIKNKLDANTTQITGAPVYLHIDAEENDPYIYIDYWTTNCEAANELRYGTLLHPVNFIPVEKNSCILLKKARGGKSVPGNEELLPAYKLALTTRNRLYSASDYENYCRLKFGDKLQNVQIRRGIMCSSKPKAGLVRTIDICLTFYPEYREMMQNPVTQSELKTELEKQSPYLYNFRILMENEL
ncbi:MAG: hypothetical protein FWF53_03030 [Candidatus Azobacteroides sp.]|nr:hypothetical protein [Candidatus Azobacteroides sp.]